LTFAPSQNGTLRTFFYCRDAKLLGLRESSGMMKKTSRVLDMCRAGNLLRHGKVL